MTARWFLLSGSHTFIKAFGADDELPPVTFQSVVDTVDERRHPFSNWVAETASISIFRELGLETAGIEGSVTLSQRGRDKGTT